MLKWPFLRKAVILCFVAATTPARAQGTRSDYERANKLLALTQDKVFRASVEPHWFADNTRFWYRNDLPGGAREFVLIDAVNAAREPAFDHARLASALTQVTGTEYNASHLPIEKLELTDTGDAIRFMLESKKWRCELSTYTLSEDDFPESTARTEVKEKRSRQGSRARRQPESPDATWVTFIKDHNLYLRLRETGEEFQLSDDGQTDDAYSADVFWSPDAKKLVALRTKRGDDRKVYLIESSPKDQLQPKLRTVSYLKPGDQISIGKPRLFDADSQREIAISDQLFSNPWSIQELRWAQDSSRFTFLYNQRGHQLLRIVAVDAKTGDARAVVDEQSQTFIDYAHKRFSHYLDATNEIIWMSERDGWNHLYLYDAQSGQVKNQITRGQWVVRGVDRVDEQKRQVWFRAGGIYPDQDPYYIHFCRINFDGTGLVILTDGNGTHTIKYSPDSQFTIDTCSRVDLPPVSELRRVADGTLVCELERADMTALLETGWKAPERFVAKGRDGTTDIYGVIYRPSNFDPQKSYPVIEQVYAGPQGAFVPKQFLAYHPPQSTAELGFIVVQIDGMGTNHRSKAYHDVCWKNLGDSGFPDRILWIKAAAAKYPYMDLSRVGIYGNSAGGQSALGAVLAHPDFYKVAVASCGCHDNRMDKIWWNELWMGWPVGSHYAEQSNVTNAEKLRGKLLLIVGELDRNVDPASTMQVVNALVQANKDFDLLVLPGAGHGVGGAYGLRRLQDFFVRHLLGVEPPDRNTDGEPLVAKSEGVERKVVPASEQLRRTWNAEPLKVPEIESSRSELRGLVERYTADRGSLERFYTVTTSPVRHARLKQFFTDVLSELARIDFDRLSQAGRIDYLLLKNQLNYELRQLDVKVLQVAEMEPLLPFSKTIIELEEARRRMEPIDSAKTGALLTDLKKEIENTRQAIETAVQQASKANSEVEIAPVKKTVANRAAATANTLRNTLRTWFGFYNGYDPLFTWWVGEPYNQVDQALGNYASFLRERVVGLRAEDREAIIGDPIGSEALRSELAHEMIPYAPEELIAMAEREWAWCEAEMIRASRDLSHGDDWHKALEHVKTLYVEPGQQPELIRKLALEAIEFIDRHELVTVPQLARESWRMEMMSPQRQLVNPFFTGGETISVSFPTNTMPHEAKLMSMRGNNIHFSRATVHHELIPGHHLQEFMTNRYRTYRGPFSTAFWTEGWALYWEMLLWDMGFAQSAEDRVGMLFWRMHRCARIIFSLKFHLEQMSPEECIELLVDRVGHERDNATAEVRRSFNGSYSPLYQCAYMLGGLQLRALHRELVESGKMTNREFHDAILKENRIPIEMVRAILTQQELTRDYLPRWKFYED